MALTSFDTPPELAVRAECAKPVYLVGDASGTGLGSVCWKHGDPKLHAEFGSWMKSVTEEKTSNFRESANLVLRLKKLVNDGFVPKGSEVFIVTDNAVFESIYFKGSSKSHFLHETIVELKKLEMERTLIVHVFWISGKRMIKIGVDGLSRGDLSSGVMAGNDLLSYLPFNETALQRHPELYCIVSSWIQGSKIDWNFCSKVDWFDRVFNKTDANGNFCATDAGWIWSPSPLLAPIALELMCEAFHLFPKSSHIFICPALATAYWRKMLGKVADVVFNFPAGCCVWPSPMFECLTVAFVKPLLPQSPWQARRLPIVAEWESKLREVRWTGQQNVRHYLRKFWDQSY